MGDVEASVAALQRRIDGLKPFLSYASRPFVIEFAGTPKSGKSTSVEAIRHFFSRSGFRVHVLIERASVCPIPMKGHLFFNTWCASSMLAELLASTETATDILVIDRGLFDALVWLRLQERRGEVTPDEMKVIESFLLLERWRSLIDVSVVMSVSADQALGRENAQRIVRKPGSIMNPEFLEALSVAVKDAATAYGRYFPATVQLDSSGREVRDFNVELAGRLLDVFEDFLNPEILVAPRKRIEALSFVEGAALGGEAFQKALECIRAHGTYLRRDEAERREDYVQIIPCGVLTDERKAFVFQRGERDPKHQLYGRTTVWQGTHVRRAEGDTSKVLSDALAGRISNLLFLGQVFPMQGIGYCWDQSNVKSSRHFGLVHRIHIDRLDTRTNLRKKEFRRGRGHGLEGDFADSGEILAKKDEIGLEVWSRSIFSYLADQ